MPGTVTSSRYKPEDKSPGKKAVNILIGVFLLAYTLITVFPFYTMAVRSFVSTGDSTQLHLWIPASKPFNMNAEFGNMSVYFNLDTEKFKKDMGIDDYISSSMSFNEIAEKYRIPARKIKDYMDPYYTFNGWLTILRSNQFIHSLLATVFVTLLSVAAGGILGISTGFVLAGFRKKWHFHAYNLYMLQMVIPPVMLLIPQFIITKNIGLYNSYIGLILFNMRGGALSTMVFTSYIASIPKELRESVDIDGGGHFRYFRNILLPLCKVPFATYLTIQLPLYWNDLLYPLLFLKADNYTLTAWINQLIGQFATNYQAIYAGLVVSLLPILLVYLIFQRLFVQAAMSGAVKG